MSQSCCLEYDIFLKKLIDEEGFAHAAATTDGHKLGLAGVENSFQQSFLFLSTDNVLFHDIQSVIICHKDIKKTIRGKI